MSDRLLSELFPRFVKKSQLEHLAKGPFGEGLLEKQGKRVYLKPGEQAPEGANVQTGARGGKYYDEPGGGGATTPDTSFSDIPSAEDARTGFEGMSPPGSTARDRRPYSEGGPHPLEDFNYNGKPLMPAKETQGATVEEVPAFDGGKFIVSESGQQGRSGEDQFSMRHESPDGTVTEMGSHPSLEGAKKMARNRGITSSNPNYEQPTGMPAHDEARDPGSGPDLGPNYGVTTGDAKYDELASKFDAHAKDERGYLEDVSEPAFSDGAVLLPGSDPLLVQDIIDEGASKEQLDSLAQQFKDEQGYTDEQFNQYWNSVDDLSELMEDRSLDDLSIQDAFRYDKSGYDKPFYPGPSEDQMGTLENFRDWLQSKAGGNQGETQKMVKMMQKYNVDNKRRDPIVLSNKGGRQR